METSNTARAIGAGSNGSASEKVMNKVELMISSVYKRGITGTGYPLANHSASA